MGLLASSGKDYIKSYQLVGEYLSAWAHMESRLDGAIGNALHLTNLQQIIVCANIGFTSKCHILKTLVSLVFIENGKDYEKAIVKIQNLTTDRNMIAHNAFFPSDEKEFAVQFFVFKAKGKLSIPKTTWKEEQFKKRIYQLRGYAKTLENLESHLSYKDIANALMKKDGGLYPSKGLLGLGSLGLLAHPPPVDHTLDSSLAKLRINPQTQQKPRGK
jgi:hypothetical protein